MSSYLEVTDSVLSMSCFASTPDVSVKNYGSVDNELTSDDVTRSDELPFSSGDLLGDPGQEIVAASGCEPDVAVTAAEDSKLHAHGIGVSATEANKMPEERENTPPPTGRRKQGEPPSVVPKEANYCPLVTSVETNKRYNFMVAGGSGAGKSTFCHTTFRRHFHNFSMPQPDGPTEKIGECGRGDNFDDENAEERILVTVIDTVGGFSSTEHINPILEYLETQHREYEKNELYRRVNTRALQDTRIACLFYFFGPHRVHDDDIRFLKCLHDVVPIVPIVAKADSLTVIELAEQLQLIRARLTVASIQYYDFGEVDINEDWLERPFERQAFTNLGMVMSAGAINVEVPAPQRPMVRNVFAVISNERRYIWGTATEDEPAHSDTMRLRKVLFGSLGKLADKMDELHEQWRDEHKKSPSWIHLPRLDFFKAIAFAAGVVILNALCLFYCNGWFEEGIVEALSRVSNNANDCMQSTVSLVGMTQTGY